MSTLDITKLNYKNQTIHHQHPHASSHPSHQFRQLYQNEHHHWIIMIYYLILHEVGKNIIQGIMPIWFFYQNYQTDLLFFSSFYQNFWRPTEFLRNEKIKILRFSILFIISHHFEWYIIIFIFLFYEQEMENFHLIEVKPFRQVMHYTKFKKIHIYSKIKYVCMYIYKN